RRRHTRFSRDWSSDVCSSDLADGHRTRDRFGDLRKALDRNVHQKVERQEFFEIVLRERDEDRSKFVAIDRYLRLAKLSADRGWQIGRASCRERGWIMVGGGSV